MKIVLFLALCTLTHAASPTKAIINTDPGVDDSMAILLALASPEIDLIAICVNYGSLHNTTTLTLNALRVLELANRTDIPVYIGAHDPLASPFHDLGGENFHGSNGLGNIDFPLPSSKPNLSMSAPDFIVSAALKFPGEIVIFSLSPPTNIALATKRLPMLPTLIKKVHMMGGTVFEAGNVNPVSEANIANDALGSRVVFNAGYDIVMAGLDVTMATHMTTEYIASLASIGNQAGKFISLITQFYIKAYNKIGFPYMPVHDPSAVMSFLRPDIYTHQDWNVQVEVAEFGHLSHGMTVADRRAGPNSPPPPPSTILTRVLLTVDAESFRTEYMQRIMSLP